MRLLPTAAFVYLSYRCFCLVKSLFNCVLVQQPSRIAHIHFLLLDLVGSKMNSFWDKKPCNFSFLIMLSGTSLKADY